jgi:hypothetical protein
MNVLARGLVLFGLSLLATSVFAQSEPDAAILKVNGQEVFQSDLELVKSMLPLERYKTTKARTNLIDSIYVEFLIEKTLFEQQGIEKVTLEDVAELRDTLTNQEIQNQVNEARYLGFSSVDGYFARQIFTSSVNKKILEQEIAEQSPITKPASQLQNPNSLEEQEKKLTTAFLLSRITPAVAFQAMLLENQSQVQLIQAKLKRGQTFSDLSDTYSLVHHYSGGSNGFYGDKPQIFFLSNLEPELQNAISTAGKPGIYIFQAPFNRFWFVKIHKFPATHPFAGVTKWNLNTSFSGEFRSEYESILGNKRREAKLEFLTSDIELFNKLILKVADLEIYASEYFSSFYLTRNFNPFEEIFKELISKMTQISKSNMLYRAKLHKGINDDGSLQAYLAARMKFSESQLKAFYVNNKEKYNFKQEQSQMMCSFSNINTAKYWNNLFIVNPNSFWVRDRQIEIQYCDFEDRYKKLPLPENPTKATLTPIPGGFITGIGQSNGTYYFLVLYKYQPKSTLRSFALARSQVEYDYRMLVARKQMPQFWEALEKKLSVQYYVKEFLQELEKAGK